MRFSPGIAVAGRLALPAMLLGSLLGTLAACSPFQDDGGVDLSRRELSNSLAYVPPQCFTRTQDKPGQTAQNPCYVCHAEAREPNFLHQPELQLSYALPQVRAGKGIVNDWTNLFQDRRDAIAKITDSDMLDYVQTDNYHDESGGIALAARLKDLPEKWDINKNKVWNGYTPDAWFNFNAQGFDMSPQGSLSGWRTYSYYPFPGAFLPTNGSFDDVLIRLPTAFRKNAQGQEDISVYTVNLAIVEALMRRRDIAIDAVDEKALGLDVDHDGKLGKAVRVAFDWDPVKGRNMSYAGQAAAEQKAGKVHLAAGLFPEGTEFLHSVRYLDVVDDKNVAPARRMKELRYARKHYWMSYSDLSHRAIIENKEDALNPDRPAMFDGNAETGLDNAMGWTYQGFIEDKRGALRPQTQEETTYCMGCHGRISVTDDSIFSFSRKISGGDAHGWQHWLAQYKTALPDPVTLKGHPEYATYLRNNHAGDEFRANDEVQARFFDAKGEPRQAAFEALGKDINTLLLPSAKRALTLDKAYQLIVREQSFIKGRDPVVTPAKNVYREIGLDESTGITAPADMNVLR
jgi:hypothetical protein